MIRHALVTGATGFLGLHLTEALRSSQWDVSALCRPTSDTSALRSLGVRILVGDVIDRDSVHAALRPEMTAIFHCAGDLNVWRPNNDAQTQTNVQGTINVVAAALNGHKPRLIHVSTLAAYGRQSAPITESTPSTAADSWINYERSKYQADQHVRDAASRGLPAMIVAPAALIGPRDHFGWAKLLIDLSHQRVPFCPPGAGTFNDVRAVASALTLCADKGVAGETYLLSGETLTFTDLIRSAAREMGVKSPRVTLPPALMRPMVAGADWWSTRRGVEPPMTREMAALLCRRTICGSRKAELELGYQPMPIAQALTDSIRWLRGAGLLAGLSAETAA